MDLPRIYHYYTQHPRVFIDNRLPIKDGLFIAVGQKDERGCHRGNRFATAALENGQAAYVLINDAELKAKHAEDERYVLVEDGVETLQALSGYHLLHWEGSVLAIAGSNGKTTFKELLHCTLAQRYRVFSTRGNLNNHLGVPLSVLSLTAEHELAILELGANHLGETRFLAELLQPAYGVVTNCGKDHLGEYGSVENIERANKELYDVLAENGGQAFVHSDNPTLMRLAAEVERQLLYGSNQAVQAEVLKAPFLVLKLWLEGGTVEVSTQLFGAFWAETLLGVAAVGQYFGVPPSAIQAALEGYQPAALRSEQRQWRGNRLLLDCYNANPSSMSVFLEAIQSGKIMGEKVLILGEMAELGAYALAEHQALVAAIEYNQYRAVWLVGPSFLEVDLPQTVQHYSTTAALKQVLLAQAYKDCTIFVKGSRSNRLEQLFEEEAVY